MQHSFKESVKLAKGDSQLPMSSADLGSLFKLTSEHSSTELSQSCYSYHFLCFFWGLRGKRVYLKIDQSLFYPLPHGVIKFHLFSSLFSQWNDLTFIELLFHLIHYQTKSPGGYLCLLVFCIKRVCITDELINCGLKINEGFATVQYSVCWEPEGCYQYLTIKPEGRYHCTKSMAIVPFWFSMEHC